MKQIFVCFNYQWSFFSKIIPYSLVINNEIVLLNLKATIGAHFNISDYEKIVIINFFYVS